jgi:hypothetical protein
MNQRSLSLRRRLLRLGVIPVIAAALIGGATTAASASTSDPAFYPWNYTWLPGNCGAKVDATWVRATNHASINVEVDNFAWFSACRANVHLRFHSSDGATIYAQQTEQLLGCAWLDPTCPSSTSRNFQVDNVVPPSEVAHIDSAAVDITG